MAVITPNTELRLLKVPLEIDEINQLTFANAEAQYNYFNSLTKLPVDDFTYQRKDGTIRFGANFDEILTYNYVMYQNTEYSDKWFYAFITDMQYVNDNMTMITIKTDVWQTWMFDLSFKPVLIDREHANTDVAGDNLLPEGLELGDYVTNGGVVNFAGVGGVSMNQYRTVVEVSQIENYGSDSTLTYQWTSGTHPSTPLLNSVERGTVPLVIPQSYSASNVLKVYDIAGLSESIVNVYMLPSYLIQNTNELTITGDDNNGTSFSTTVEVPDTKFGTYTIATSTFTKPTSIDGYTPVNKKLLTSPFCYFNISNNSGSSLPYAYEDFSTSNVQFKTEGTFGVSGNTKTFPLEYKNISSSENSTDYSITGAKFPVCSWKSDSYTNWLTQNAVNMRTQWTSAIVGGLIGVGSSGLASGFSSKGVEGIGFGKGFGIGSIPAGAEMAGNLISVAREQHLAKTQANMVSDQVKGNLNAGDIAWAKYGSPFTYLPMSIKRQFAECIDQFFSQFGYKCNRVKLPNITGRRNWNYVKTVGCYIDADIPQSDLQEIKNMFDRGVTFWHNPSTFGDYSQNNDII